MEELRELRQREMEYEVQILRFNPKSLADTVVNTIDDSLRAAIQAATNDCNITIADDVVQTVGDRIVDMKTTQTYFDNFEKYVCEKCLKLPATTLAAGDTAQRAYAHMTGDEVRACLVAAHADYATTTRLFAQHVAYAHELKQRLDDLSKEHQLMRSAIALLNGEPGDDTVAEVTTVNDATINQTEASSYADVTSKSSVML